MPHGPHALVTDGVTEADAAMINPIITDINDTYSTGEVDALIPTALTDLDTTVTGAQLDSDHTKLAGIEALADVTDATNVAAAGAVMEADTSTSGFGFVVDEDDMASDSATKVPTQQSVKAYVDANAGGGELPYLPPVAAHTSDFINVSTNGIGNGGSGTFAVSADVIYFHPIFVNYPLTPDKVSVEVTTGSSAGSMRVGVFIYDQPSRLMTLVEDYGTAATTTTGQKDITPGTGTSLGPAWYWLGVWFDEACTMRAVSNRKSSIGVNSTYAIGNNAGVTYSATFGSFAASYTVPANTFTSSLIAVGISD